MAARFPHRLAGALLVALALAGCSDSDGSSSGAAPSPSESSPTSSSSAPAAGEVCASLSDVKTAAEAIKSDVQEKQLSALTTDVPALKAAVNDLIQAMSAGAQQSVADVRSAWDNVESTVQGMDKSDLGQARSTLQGPVDQLRSTLESVGSDLNCS
jgi:hypothetical protein